MQTHYIDFVPVNRVIYEVYARLLKGVHLANVEGHELSVDWPEWREERGQFGRIMRVFGTEAGIEHLLERITPLLANDLLKCANAISPVPDCITGTHWYRRDRKADKNTPSHIGRLKRRAALRGEVHVPPISARSPGLHTLRLQSESTRKSFYMDICRKGSSDEPERQKPSPDIYGFGVVVPSF